MTTPDDAMLGRSYGCSFACGNPYDIIITTVANSETLMVCAPCFTIVARDMVAAFIDAADPAALAAMQEAADAAANAVPGPSGKPGKHNRPVGQDNLGLFGEFEPTVTVDQLPDEFR